MAWSEKRRGIRDWLQGSAPSLSQLYEACITMLYLQPAPMPGWPRLVSHCVREIRNQLPSVVGGKRVSKQVQYVQHLDEVARLWHLVDVGEPPEQTLDATQPGTRPPPNIRSIPRRLFDKLDELVRQHLDGRERRTDAAFRLFETLTQEGEGRREALEPMVNQWLDVTDWFQGRTHDSGADDSQFDIDEFRRKFELVEDTLAGLVRDFFTTTGELDAILEDTNS